MSVLFMKGTKQFPAVRLLCDGRQNPRAARRDLQGRQRPRGPGRARRHQAFSNWPTIPQLYIKGEFVGGCDIMREMYQAGELHDLICQKGIPHQHHHPWLSHIAEPDPARSCKTEGEFALRFLLPPPSIRRLPIVPQVLIICPACALERAARGLAKFDAGQSANAPERPPLSVEPHILTARCVLRSASRCRSSN